MSKGKMFVISGASGVGKGTVLARIMAKRDDLTFSVSATTRPPRPGEVDGREYYFLDRARFEEMIRENLETASKVTAGELTDDDQAMLRQVVKAINAKMKVG